eukprot:1154170-Pelagomonas_calceolata.AAC.1
MEKGFLPAMEPKLENKRWPVSGKVRMLGAVPLAKTFVSTRKSSTLASLHIPGSRENVYKLCSSTCAVKQCQRGSRT